MVGEGDRKIKKMEKGSVKNGRGREKRIIEKERDSKGKSDGKRIGGNGDLRDRNERRKYKRERNGW